MNTQKLIYDYLTYLQNNEKTNRILSKKKPSILLYGSSVYGVSNSDLDVAFIMSKFIQQEFQYLKEATIAFQEKNNMRIDEEVPYINKLLFTHEEVEDMLQNSPFKINESGQYIITPINKQAIEYGYFNTKEMKYRLLLNILTTRSIVLFGQSEIIDNYRKRAFEVVIKIVFSYYELTKIEINKFIDYLWRDEKNNLSGEDFLGYKNKHIQTMQNLKTDLLNILNELVDNELFEKTEDDIFIPTTKWAKKLIKSNGLQ